MSGSAHPGVFVTLEGGEGSGKSTLVAGLAAHFRAKGLEVVATREPGGTPGAEQVRALIVTGEGDRWSPLSEALLFTAARNDHLERRIRPALQRGALVLCDRYLDSTRAYQAAGGNVPDETCLALASLISAEEPDLTLLLDLPPADGLRRSRGAATGEQRFEDLELAFHERVRSRFQQLAQEEPDRFRQLDAARPAEAVLAQATRLVTDTIERKR